jgi:hypothetical protein
MPQTPDQFASTGMTPEQFGGSAPTSESLLSKGEDFLKSHMPNHDPTGYWPEYQREVQQGMSAVKQDVRGAQTDPNILHAATDLYIKAPWHILGLIGSPITSALQVGVINPVDSAIDLAGKRIAGMFPKGPANQPGWTVHSGDVKQLIRPTQEFVNAGINAATMLAGGSEAAADVPKPTEEINTPAKLPDEVGGKPRMRVVGTTETGKPRVRMISPEEAAANVSKATEEVTQKSTVADMPHSAKAVGKLWQGFHELEARVRPDLEKLGNEATVGQGIFSNMSAQDVLAKHLIPNAPRDLKPLLLKLQQHLGDVNVHFTPVIAGSVKIGDAEGFGPDYNTLGMYTWDRRNIHEPGTIQIATGEHNQLVAKTVIHEMVHAATSRFIDRNPNAPEVADLRRLYDRARSATKPTRDLMHDMGEKLEKTKSGSTRLFYGEHDLHEFVAEALSNPKFQNFLSKIKLAGKTAWHALGSIILNILGLPEKDGTNLIHHVMQASTKIMERQTEMDRDAGLQMAASRSQDLASQAMKVEPVTKAVKDSAPVRKLAAWVDELQRALAPETLGPRAVKAGSIIASRTAEYMRNVATWRTGSKDRLMFWARNSGLFQDFMRSAESGKPLDNPDLENMRLQYKQWNANIAKRDIIDLHFDYQPRDNYMMHIFKDPLGVAKFLTNRHGTKWYNPGFIKDRTFDLYDEAVKAGFDPLYKNPEEIMLARQLASDKAAMQINILNDLRHNGLAILKQKGMKVKPGIPVGEWRAPNGETFLVHEDVHTMLSNIFGPVTGQPHSLWQLPGIRGDAFRGYMHLKNAVVPLKLAMSIFHPIHISQIDNVNALSYAIGNRLAGVGSTGDVLAELAKSATGFYKPFVENPRTGLRVMKVFKGLIPKEQLTDADSQALQYMLEGGFVPDLSEEFKSKAMQNFHQAVLDHSVKAIFKFPGAVMHGMAYPIFNVWIPSLKTAAYLDGVRATLLRNPELYDDVGARRLAFRRVAKSIDNRYGEMNLDTLFMKRYVRDTLTANTLSLGWQLGLFREYGGAVGDLASAVKAGSLKGAATKGLLDRLLFVGTVSTSAALINGAISWSMSGKPPDSPMDFIWPRVGTDAKGNATRLGSPFYLTVVGDMGKRIRNEGVAEGVKDIISSKSVGVAGMLGSLVFNRGEFGRQIRDPNAPLWKQTEQTLSQIYKDLEPISFSSLKRAGVGHYKKSLGMSFAGFNPAPKYVTETPNEVRIWEAYDEYEGKKTVPYSQVQRSADYRKLREYYQSNDGRFYTQLDHMQTKYKLNESEIYRITRELEDNISPSVRAFGELPWEEQKRLLDRMTPEERMEYLPHSNATHLRDSYEAPNQ